MQTKVAEARSLRTKAALSLQNRSRRRLRLSSSTDLQDQTSKLSEQAKERDLKRINQGQADQQADHCVTWHSCGMK